MERVLSKSMLIAIALLIVFSAGCAKRTIPNTIAEVERSLFAFQQYEITYDELKEQIGDYYIDFDHTVGENEFAGHDETTYLYKDLAGMSLEEIHAIVDPIYESFAEMGLDLTVSSSQVSISAPEDAMANRQLVYTWREDIIENFNDGPATKVTSTRYFFTEADGEWKIDWLDSGECYLTGDEERDAQMLANITFDENEGEYTETITLK